MLTPVPYRNVCQPGFRRKKSAFWKKSEETKCFTQEVNESKVEKSYVYKGKAGKKIVNILNVKGGSRAICIYFKESHAIEKTCKSWQELEVKAKVNKYTSNTLDVSQALTRKHFSSKFTPSTR